MSRVISFRLDENNEDNPDEARALAILEAWEAKGWKPRELLTRALLYMEGIEPVSSNQELIHAFQEALDQVRATDTTHTLLIGLHQAIAEAKGLSAGLALLPDVWQALDEIRQFANTSHRPELPALSAPEEPALRADFMASVKKAARPGLKLNSKKDENG